MTIKDALKTTKNFQELFESKKQSKIIMFADMVDSTTYKRDHSIFDGLRKVMWHNNIIIDITTEFEGKKVKEIGDEVMVCFDSDKEENAINAAIKIQETFNNVNAQEKRKGVEKMESQIGITYGKEDVLPLDNGDLHGTPVDIAKRLVGMAKPMQILIDGNLKASTKEDKITSKYLEFAKIDPKMKLQPRNVISMNPVRRNVKGIKEVIEIYEVRWGSGFLEVKDEDRLASEWKKAHECLTEVLTLLDRLRMLVNNIDLFKELWSELRTLDNHPYKRLLDSFYRSIELQYDETGKDKDETGKKKMELLEKTYEKVGKELKKAKPTALSHSFKEFSMTIINFLALADKRLKETFDIEGDE